MPTLRFALTLLLACTAACRAPLPAPLATTASGRDSRIQRIASEELERTATEWGATRAAVVVVDPRSGVVLAMDGREGDRPAPSLPSDHAWITGSTLKPITIAAALDARTITLEQRFPCGARSYGTQTLHDAAEGACAPLDARGIVAQSSNVGVSYVFDTLGSARLTAWFRKLHIGDSPGALPKIDDDKSLRAAEFAGGEVAEATPLQLVLAYTAFFNDGVYAPSAGRVLETETARTMVALLENAVEGDGTGKGARVTGARVAGKTGTADLSDEAGKEETYVSFVGTVLDREPHFVALMGFEVPGEKASGPKVAAPAWGRLAARIIGER